MSIGAPRQPDRAEPDPVIEAYKRDLDRTLLRANRRSLPEERVLALMALQRLATEPASRAALAHRPHEKRE